MKINSNRLVGLFFLLALMSPALSAMEMVDPPKKSIGNNKHVEQFLHGDFISLSGQQLNTSLGAYPLTNMVKVVDERTQGGSPAKVQLVMRNSVLIKVVIYE